ncbi:MAG: hypothetical protein LH473_00655 [Chitinophagales bacterium]|nr:hypothetical protein [Chitinophagales bacterium]
MKSSFFFTLLLLASMSNFAQIFESSAVTDNTFVTSSFINDNEGWLADNNAMLFHTKNAGLTWDSISVSKNFVKLDFADALIGYGISSDGGAYKTTDGSYTWTYLYLPGNISKVLYFLDSKNGFIGGYQMIFKTTDGDTTWETINTEDVSFSDFYFTSSLIGIAVVNDDAANNRCVWRTIDGGSSWKNVCNATDYLMNAVWFTNENTGWAAGYCDRGGIMEPSILNTIDGGQTWNIAYGNWPVDSKGEAFSDIRFRNEKEGYAISRFAYDVYTTDGGASWNLIHDSETLGLSPLYGVYKTLDGYNNLYLSGENGNVAMWK